LSRSWELAGGDADAVEGLRCLDQRDHVAPSPFRSMSD
jgi:hypothetical protein